MLLSSMENSSQYLMQCPTYYALLHLYRELRYLWIDSICINQAGRDEKATQIPLMSQICRGATRNIAYLGDAEDARLVPDFVGRLNVATLQRLDPSYFQETDPLDRFPFHEEVHKW
jgi:hypothetical protein